MAGADIIGAFARAAMPTCVHCGGPVGLKANSAERWKKYCSPACAASGHRRGLAKPHGQSAEFQCANCSASVIRRASSHNDSFRFCSKSCWNDHQRARRATAICQQCGASFDRRNRGPHDANKYCSRACGFAGSRKPKQPKPVLTRQCTICSVPFAVAHNAMYCGDECRKEHARRKARASAAKAHGVPVHTCKECRVTFSPPYGSKLRKFCSPSCLHTFGRREHRKRYGNNHRKRARLLGVRYESINRLKVFERDRWRCQLCGRKCQQRLSGSNCDAAPELDHIIPLALGGGHTYENVQLACRGCNGAKGATRAFGQLNLFPKLLTGTRSTSLQSGGS